LTFWGGEGESSKVLKIQKWILHLMKGVNSKTSCRPILKELQILLPPSIFMRFCVIFGNIIYTVLEILICMDIILEGKMISMCEIATQLSRKV
jgi:hypothetical protein